MNHLYNQLIREATATDAEAIEELEMMLFPNNSMGAWTVKRELLSGKGWVVYDSSLVAYALVRLESNLADLTRLGVRQSHQRRGIGRKLLERALNERSHTMLTVNKDNFPALQLYREYRFQIVGEQHGSWMMSTSA